MTDLTKKLSRRRFLRGASGTVLTIPLLEAALEREARAGETGRFVGFFTTGGTVPQRHYPLVGGAQALPDNGVPVPYYVSGLTDLDTTDHVMSPILEPLTANKKDLLIIEGIDPRGYGGHNLGECLVGRDWKPSRVSPGISLDQEIARNTSNKFRSLELGVNNFGQGDKLGQISWLGPNLPARAENSPAAVFKRVFAELPPAAGTDGRVAFERRQALQKSMLDDSLGQIATLQTQVGTADRAKLQSYFDLLREVERSLRTQVPAATGSCGQPPAPPAVAGKTSPVDVTTKTQIDLLVMALACDLTRVATLVIGQGGSDLRHPFIGVDEPLHNGLGHAGSENVALQVKMTLVQRWYASQFSYLIDRLRTFGVLDGTVAMWGLELSRGNKHSNFNIPWVLAGRGRNYFRTGRYVRFARPSASPYNKQGRSETELFVEVLRAVGLPATSFGDPAFYTRAMDNLRGA